MSIKRHNVVFGSKSCGMEYPHLSEVWAEMQPSPDGEWVRYKDYLEERELWRERINSFVKWAYTSYDAHVWDRACSSEEIAEAQEEWKSRVRALLGGGQ